MQSLTYERSMGKCLGRQCSIYNLRWLVMSGQDKKDNSTMKGYRSTVVKLKSVVGNKFQTKGETNTFKENWQNK